MNLEDGKCGCKSLPAPPQNCHPLEKGDTILGAVFTLKNYPLKKKSELLSVSLQTGPMWGLCYGHKIPLKKIQEEFEIIWVEMHQQHPKSSGFSLKTQWKNDCKGTGLPASLLKFVKKLVFAYFYL